MKSFAAISFGITLYWLVRGHNSAFRHTYMSLRTTPDMDVNKIMKKFTALMYQAKLDQAEQLIKKYSRNRRNELARQLFSLGHLHGIMKIYDLAIFCLDLSQEISRDIELKKKSKEYLVAALNLRASLLTKAGQFDQAKLDYTRAISLMPGLSQTHNNYAILLRKMGCFEEAKNQYLNALELNPDNYEVLHNYAILLIRIGDLEGGEQLLEKPLEADFFPAKLTLSLILIRKSEYKKAENLLHDLLDTNPEDPRILANLGIAIFAQGIFDESIEYFLQAKEQFVREGSMKDATAVEGHIDWANATKAWAAGDVDTSSQLFRSASERLDQEGFEEQSLATYILSLLIPLDQGITVSLQSSSLQKLRESVQSLYQQMNMFLNVDSPRIPHFQILFCKSKYIEILHHALHFEDYDIEELERSKPILRQFDFSRDLQLVNSLDIFLQELRHYRNLEDIPRTKEEELLRMIQPFHTLNELVTRELSRRAQDDIILSQRFFEERMYSMEERLLQKMDENKKETIGEIQYSRELIIGMINIKYKDLIDHLSRLNEQQLQRFQELAEEALQSEISRIEDNKKRKDAKTRWDQLKKLASVTLDTAGFIASMIQIYQFIKEGQVELAFEQVEILLNSLLGKIT